jgi:nondiscriminating aspartyl-tRNA synthetase
LQRTHYTSELGKQIGKTVVLSGWVHDVRLIGGINFVLLRDKDGIVQVTVHKKKVSPEILKIVEKLHQEDVISVKGKVVKSSVAKAGIEIFPEKIVVLNKSEVPLPLDPRGVTPANLDTQLDWRVLHFRTEEARAIFKIQATIAKAFRDFFTARGYLEIQPPVIIATASEGGAELFSVKYFDRDAYLAQSPQLYKQMCALAFEKVFCILPVFRAEKFEQPTHLNEIRQMDMEQAFATDEDAMQILEQCVAYILQTVKEKNSKELKILNRDLQVPRLPIKRITYTEAVKILQKAGEKIEWGDDFSKTQEKILSNAAGEFVFITSWPAAAKAFYAMPDEKNPKLAKAFDLLYNGLEIASGTQRIHIPELLEKQLRSKGLDPKNFKSYIDAFRYGSPVHSGWSIGLERLTMKVCGKSNIREVTMFPRDRNRITP